MAREHGFVKALGSHGYAIDIKVEILTGDSFADRDIVYSGRQHYREQNLALFDALPRSDKSTSHALRLQAQALN